MAIAAERDGRASSIRPTSVVDGVYDSIYHRLMSLEIAPGARIPIDVLSRDLGVSQTPIREALVRLASEGLVETLPNRSTLVANIDVLNLNPFFDAITLMYRVTTRLAAQHHRPEDLEVIRARQTEFAAAVLAQDALAMIATNRQFHAAIAEAGRNPYYCGLFVRLLDDGRRLLRLYYQSFDDRLPEEYVHEHEEMIDAIAGGDVARADALARAHADQIVRQIQRLVAADNRQDIPL